MNVTRDCPLELANNLKQESSPTIEINFFIFDYACLRVLFVCPPPITSQSRPAYTSL